MHTNSVRGTFSYVIKYSRLKCPKTPVFPSSVAHSQFDLFAAFDFFLQHFVYLQYTSFICNARFYLQRTFFICSVLFYLQRTFFICSVSFLFAAYFFYLQRTFFCRSKPCVSSSDREEFNTSLSRCKRPSFDSCCKP